MGSRRYQPQDETATLRAGALVRVIGDGACPWGHDEFTTKTHDAARPGVVIALVRVAEED